MAEEHDRRALQDAHELRPFVMPNVRPTGKKLGGGAYGCVVELEVDGLTCAGKKIHEVLINPGNAGADRMVEKYYDECRLLSNIRHPNIVQFLGICFLGTQADSPLNLPVLVMERLDRSLHDLLENTPDVPLANKCSILQDVARGLMHLHSCSPAIVHRDLTARNVLLDAALVAKIADMGNSRIVDLKPGQLAKTMTTQAPGTIVYMPPEAFEDPPQCGTQLDMFSFGHLTLFTVTQQFPCDLLPATYNDPSTGLLNARNEVQRRNKYVTTAQAFDGSQDLVQLITQCLDNLIAKRPSAIEALEKLQNISAKIDDRYHSMTRLQLEEIAKSQDAKDEQLRQLEERNVMLKERIRQLQEQAKA